MCPYREDTEIADGPGFRAAIDIPENAFVVGHVSRLVPEKNIEFLAEAVAEFLQAESRGHFLVVGRGPSLRAIREVFCRKGIADRLHATDILEHNLLVSAYRAMDVFAFASKSETQGMVLTEAMAAGIPVVALDAQGVREVVADHRNGRLLHTETIQEFSFALQWVASLSPEGMQQLKLEAECTAKEFSMGRSVDKALALYENVLEKESVHRHDEYNSWTAVQRLVKTEWDALKRMAKTGHDGLKVHELEREMRP